MEKWKNIDGYEGKYKISSLGRIMNKNGTILKPSTTKKGYKRIVLYKNGSAKGAYIHRLVALAFIPNPDNLPQVNHKDENKLNNCAENLEWCDAKYNTNYGSGHQRAISKQKVSIIAFDEIHKLGIYYPSMREAERDLGVNFRSLVDCLKGGRKHAKGYKFEYDLPQ